ncbi:MAG: precorrin-6A/cobalt-precorrin-6A reductase [Pseudomonadota bacterium]
MPKGRVLVLAGTAEARAVLERAQGLDVLASLAGRTADPGLPVPARIGGFGGAAGFLEVLSGCSAVLDATHPFAARITARTARLCAEAAVPYLRLTRPSWGAETGWTRHTDMASAAEAMSPDARILLTTGPGGLDAFLGRGLTLWCRRVDPAPAQPGVHWITGLPGDLSAETDLMRRLRITDLVSKNSGGPHRAKLDAAEGLGIRVHMIDRPPTPPGEETHDIGTALAFLAAHADHSRSR